MDRYLEFPFTKDKMKELKAGDYVYISGIIYTARDAAHKRLYESLHNGEKLPLDLQDNLLYYMGPSPAREGRPISTSPDNNDAVTLSAPFALISSTSRPTSLK